MTVCTSYLTAVRALTQHFELPAQVAAVEAASDLVVHAMQHGGCLYCGEIGHGGQGDFINRAGGLVGLHAFTWGSNLHQPVPAVRREADKAAGVNGDRTIENIRHALRTSSLKAPDVLLVSSVSGRNAAPIELALAARERGVKVIGFTSLTYTAKVESLHPSGKRLAAAVDVVVDNGAPYGDAAITIPGYPKPLVPLSGIGMDMAGWLIWSRAMEKMAAAGTPASVLISHNGAGGPEHNDESRKRYEKLGY